MVFIASLESHYTFQKKNCIELSDIRKEEKKNHCINRNSSFTSQAICCTFHKTFVSGSFDLHKIALNPCPVIKLCNYLAFNQFALDVFR